MTATLFNFLGSVVGGAIVGQVCFVYGKRAGRRGEHHKIVAYMRSRAIICRLSRDEIIAAVEREDHRL